MTYINQQLKQRVDEKFRRLQKLRPLPSIAVAKLREQFSIEMTYNSNAIEGNRLSLKETYLIIAEGITIKGKSFKDHLEAKDHYEALNYLYELIEHDKRHTVSESLIRNLQQIIVRDTDSDDAGVYRTGNVAITGSSHKPPEAFEVSDLMRNLIIWLRDNKNKLHPIELAAIAHHRLVNIHPFFDGNGRTARLFMNLLLMQDGYPLVMILKNDRKKYYQTLELADRGNLKPFVAFVAQAIERSLNIYLRTLVPVKSKSEKYLSLSEISGQIDFSEKYLNLLARQGKIEAHKEGRIWMTNMNAISNYLKNRQRKR